METSLHPGLRQNRLLALLDDATLRELAPQLEPTALVLRERLYNEGQAMAHAWFPIEGVLSVLGADMSAGSPIEVATIGCEGVLGVSLFLGAQRSPGTVFVQVTGSGWRLPAMAFQRALEAHADFASVIRRYTYALLVQVSQGTACNRAHPAEQRCARWLLQTHDRVSGDSFDLTQEFLAQMLGERRATVNQVASALQDRGLIRYTRGRIEVTNRQGLEDTACGCYRFVREEYARSVAPWPP
jgi:CRP-like cAMP-binding protein